MGLGASWFWPRVNDRKNILFAIEEAFWVALAVSVVVALLTVIEILRSGMSDAALVGFIESVLFAVIAIGVRLKSRVASLAGFILYVTYQVFSWLTTGHGSLVMPLLIALALLHGVRGTFAYRKLPQLPPDTPSIAESFGAMASDTKPVEHKANPE